MGILSTSLNIALVYKFLKALTTPFNETAAFELGIIDDKGNILKKKRDLKSSEERDAYMLFDRMVWKLKRLLGKLPEGNTRLATFAAALWFIKESEIPHATLALGKIVGPAFLSESKNIDWDLTSGLYKTKTDIYGIDDNLIVPKNSLILVDENACMDICGVYVYSARDEYGNLFPVTRDILDLYEDAPVSSAGGGMIAGLGAGSDGEPGLQPHNTARRGKFAGHAVFTVSNDQFHKSIRGKVPAHKYSRYLGTDEAAEEIRQYGRSNPSKSIILQNEMTGEMVYLKIGKK